MALQGLERVMGIEPTYAAWEAAVLPLNYTRTPSILGRNGAFAKQAEIRRLVSLM